MELALVLPFVLLLMLFMVQLGLVLRDQLLVVHAAREGARAAAVEPTIEAARAGALRGGALDPGRLRVVTRRTEAGSSDLIEVTVTYRSTTTVPLIGSLLGDVTLSESTTMRVE